MTAPSSYNLKNVATRIIDGPCFISFEGDSLYSTNAARMAQGILQHWRPALWAGWVTQGGDVLFDGGFDGSTAYRTQTARDYNWYTGSATVAPVTINELKWDVGTKNEPDGTGVKLCTLNATSATHFPTGDPFSGQSMSCKAVFWKDDTSVTQLRFRARRSDASAINDYDNQDVSGTAGGSYGTFTGIIPAGAGYSCFDVLTATGNNESDRFFWPIAYKFFRNDTTAGTHACFLASRGGFTATAQYTQTNCSDARRSDFYTNVGIPNVVWICIGTNNADWVSKTAYKVILRALVDNRRSIINALGVSPFIVLECPYINSSNSGIIAELVEAMYEVAQEYNDVAFINTGYLAANFAVLDGNGAGNAFLDADDIHQSSLGASYFPAITWAALKSAYDMQPTPVYIHHYTKSILKVKDKP